MTAKTTFDNARYIDKWLSDFDEYCEDAQIVEDRRWTRKENERMKDFALWFTAKYEIGGFQ